MRLIPCVLVLLASAGFCPLQAYTDPGSGLLLWQAIAGAFLGVSFLFRKHLGKFFQREESATKTDRGDAGESSGKAGTEK